MPTVLRAPSCCLLLVGLLTGCPRPVEAPASPAPPKDLVARVNGQPLTATELRLNQKANQRPLERQTPEAARQALDALILTELQAQHAVSLGLEKDPVFQEELARIEAQFRDARRTTLARYLRTHEVLEKAQVSDAQVQAYFDAHREALQQDWKLHQASFPTRAAAEAARQALDSGQPFEAVAAQAFPNIPPDQKPWESGFFSFEQLPTFAAEVLPTLKPGEVTPVLVGPGGQGWLFKLVETRPNPRATFEALKPRLVLVLKGQAFEKRLAALELELKGKARIEYLTPAVDGGVPAPGQP